MAERRKRTESEEPSRRRASTPEGREQQLTGLAMDLAEKRILEDRASAQEIVHFLKMGSVRERLEQQRLQGEIELGRVKAESFASQARTEELYMAALGAMRAYSGSDPQESQQDDYYE